MNLNKQNLINKIIYRSMYRGTKEMDVFVSSFVKSLINKLSITELNDLSEIINLNDEQIIELTNEDSNKSRFNENIIKELIKFKNNR